MRGGLFIVVLAAAALGGCREGTALTFSLGASRQLERPIEIVGEESGARLVRHPLGTARVPLHPRRVLALDPPVTDCLILLGVRPVGAPILGNLGGSGFMDYQRPYLDGTAGVLGWEGAEAYLRLRPDLILGAGTGGGALAVLERIAPTVVAGRAGPKERLVDVGAALGLPEVARARIAEYDAGLAEARRRITPVLEDQTVAIVRLHMKQQRLYGDTLQGAPLFYRELGMRPSPFVQRAVIDRKLDRVWLGEEEIAELDADHIFLFADAPARERTLALLEQSPVWAAMPARRRRQVHVGSSAFVSATLLAREHLVDEVLVALGKEPIFGR
jgi:iron complex transport system substrate-binding protein